MCKAHTCTCMSIVLYIIIHTEYFILYLPVCALDVLTCFLYSYEPDLLLMCSKGMKFVQCTKRFFLSQEMQNTKRKKCLFIQE